MRVSTARSLQVALSQCPANAVGPAAFAVCCTLTVARALIFYCTVLYCTTLCCPYSYGAQLMLYTKTIVALLLQATERAAKAEQLRVVQARPCSRHTANRYQPCAPGPWEPPDPHRRPPGLRAAAPTTAGAAYSGPVGRCSGVVPACS
jgi:hypothetical protein